MLEFFVDFAGVKDYREMYRRIYKSTGEPEDYGANADALWDILTEPFGEPVFLSCAELNNYQGRHG